jgi:LuxR family maltose regulon positive regulatory protein
VAVPPRDLAVPERLLDLLDANIDAPVQVVRAGAGWGKTTLVRRWIVDRRSDRRLIWLTLDPTMAAADMRERLAGAGVGVAGNAVTMRSAVRAVGTLGGPPTGDPLVVFDDVHALRDPDAVDVLVETVRALSTGHVVIIGRAVPEDADARLGLAFAPTILAADLRLTFRETAATMWGLLETPPPAATIRDLTDWTQGWPAGVMYAVRAGGDGDWRQGGDGGLAAAMHAYVEREVIGDLRPDDVEILRDVSVLSSDFTASLVGAMTAADAAIDRLASLAAVGEVLSSRAPRRHAYRLAPMVADTLRARLARDDPARLHRLHRAAARWYLRQRAIGEACAHAIEAHDLAVAVHAIGDHWLSFWVAGRERTVRDWLSTITAAGGGDDPTIAFVRGWIAGLHGDGDELAEATAVLEANPRASIAGPTPMHARTAVGLLRAAFVDPVGDGGIEDAHDAVEALARDSTWRTVAECLYGYHLFWCGREEDARTALAAGTEAGMRMPMPPAVLVIAHGVLALIEATRRDVIAARTDASQAIAAASRAHLAGSPAIVPALLARGLASALSDDVAAAEPDMTDAIRTARRDQTGRQLALAHLVDAHVRQLAGDRPAAAEALRAAHALVEANPGVPVLTATEDATTRRLRLRPRRIVAGPDEPTRRERVVLELLAAGLTRAQIAEELGVSVETVKSHVRSLYAKLAADSRESALERATMLGLIRAPAAAARPPTQRRPDLEVSP